MGTLIVLGVDPGDSGGLATSSGLAVPMPDSLTGLAAQVRDWAPTFAMVEAVHAFPGQGVSSCFTFGQAYGGVLGVLAALGVPTLTVEPKRWHKAILGAPDLPADKAARRKEWKRLACAWARSRWPAISLRGSARCRIDHDGMADALCLAAYGALVFDWCY